MGNSTSNLYNILSATFFNILEQLSFLSRFLWFETTSLQCAPMSNTICVTFHRFKKLQWKGQKPEFFFLFFFYLANIPLYIALYVDKTLWINVLNKVDLKLILLLALLILHNFIRNDGHTNFCEMWLQNLSFQKHIFWRFMKNYIHDT